MWLKLLTRGVVEDTCLSPVNLLVQMMSTRASESRDNVSVLCEDVHCDLGEALDEAILHP